MDWIHCNSCYFQPGGARAAESSNAGGNALHITSCGHILCSECKVKGNGVCKVCQKECNMVQLVQDLKPDEVQDYFKPPEDLLVKALNVLEFQKTHRFKLTAHKISTERKLMEIKKENKKLKEVLQKMFNDFKKLEKQNKELKAKMSNNAHLPFAHSTPIFGPTSTPCSTSKHQSFHSKLVTPHRLLRQPNSGGRFENNEHQNNEVGKHFIPTSMLTPLSAGSCENKQNS